MENLEEYAERLKNIKKKNIEQQPFMKKQVYFTDKQWDIITAFIGILLAIGMTVSVVMIVTKILN